MKNKAKYSEFAAFLREKRGEKFRSARDFCGRVKLEVSYPQYSRYEAGEQLPSLTQALAIGDTLEVPVMEMTLEWNLAQVENRAQADEIRDLLANVRTGVLAGQLAVLPQVPAKVELDDVIVFNRSHRDLFLKDPAYRDIFTYINAFHSDGEVKVDRLAHALGISRSRIQGMLDRLQDLGVIIRRGESYAAAKSNYYFPDDADFFELRQQNLRHNLDKLLTPMTLEDLQQRRSFRSLLTRELTAQQAGWVMGQVESLIGRIVELPEDPEARTIYSVCAVVGPRFSR